MMHGKELAHPHVLCVWVLSLNYRDPCMGPKSTSEQPTGQLDLRLGPKSASKQD